MLTLKLRTESLCETQVVKVGSPDGRVYALIV